jgi:hypothetical protein
MKYTYKYMIKIYNGYIVMVAVPVYFPGAGENFSRAETAKTDVNCLSIKVSESNLIRAAHVAVPVYKQQQQPA